MTGCLFTGLQPSLIHTVTLEFTVFSVDEVLNRYLGKDTSSFKSELEYLSNADVRRN
jgi:hypothetical protein